MLAITAYLSYESFTVQYGNGEFGLADYSTAADVDTAVATFVEDAGFPWIAVGSAGNIPDNDNEVVNWTLAINLGSWALTSLSDSGDGLRVNGSGSTPGYAPWDNFADAMAAILSITGNSAWPS
ncbi:MAG TPA: hypothetical protein VGG75_38490 [Trebonia sp.]